MPLYFQSLRSSSSGNCLIVRTQKTTVVIDCGLGSIRATKKILGQNIADPKEIDLVLISHLHSDHISYYPLRVFEEARIKLRVHQDCIADLINKHLNGVGLKKLKLEEYDTNKFYVGDLVIEPFRIPHHPAYPTCGFVIYHNNKKIVIATDFKDCNDKIDCFADADFIFVESNHDLELLRKYFNPNSLYHMPNPKTAELLCRALKKSKKIPQVVMLGHLSNQRNTPQIAIKEIKTAFKKDGIDNGLRVLTAPPYESSEIINL
jgi:phosphoribosyl 1,2-cyclic phosphodiesterase